ncbi:MAG: Fic family protein [Patulibacter minatonensis]
MSASSKAALQDLAGLHEQLHDQRAPERWLARLRRMTRGAVASSSVSIEGFHVTPEAAASILAGDRRPASPDDEAVAAYGRAMDHVVAFSDDDRFKWNWRVLADLHFDVGWYDADARPGRVRTGPMFITGSEGQAIYTAPEAAALDPLLDELVVWLRKGDLGAPSVVRAAMAHLHLVSIHPFADGNGRTSRVLQSLVLGRDGYLAPEVASIEEYLAAHTQEYYDALQEAHGAAYDPTLPADGWIEFCLHAHLDLARRRVDQLSEATGRWSALERLVAERGWPDRLVIALELALTSGLDRTAYTSESEISDATASADLRRLADVGLVRSEGAGRATRYGPTDALRAAVRG